MFSHGFGFHAERAQNPETRATSAGIVGSDLAALFAEHFGLHGARTIQDPHQRQLLLVLVGSPGVDGVKRSQLVNCRDLEIKGTNGSGIGEIHANSFDFRHLAPIAP